MLNDPDRDSEVDPHMALWNSYVKGSIFLGSLRKFGGKELASREGNVAPSLFITRSVSSTMYCIMCVGGQKAVAISQILMADESIEGDRRIVRTPRVFT